MAVLLLMPLSACDSGGLGPPDSAPAGGQPNLPATQESVPGPQDELPTTEEAPEPPAPPETEAPEPPPQAPQSTGEPEIALGPPLGAYEYGYDETMLVNECYGLVEGEVLPCNDPYADFRFTFAPGQGGNILPIHGFQLGEGLQGKPSQSDCESTSFLTLPLTMNLPASQSTGRYYCFRAERKSNTIHYGWLQPVDFNANGLTFNFVTFEATTETAQAEIEPHLDLSLFILSQGEQQTMELNRCFDFVQGQVASCRGLTPDVKFTQPAHYGLQGMNDTMLGYPVEDQPTRADCQSQGSMQTSQPLMTGSEGAYYCFSTNYDGGTTYGWIRPTSFDASGITFDWTTYRP
jgi:hypothetical protein